jgi:hypothetical protein
VVAPACPVIAWTLAVSYLCVTDSAPRLPA